MPLPAKPVAAFNAQYVLVAIFRSINEAASMLGVTRQCIIKNIRGDSIAANDRYWRNIPNEFIIDSET